MEHPNLPPEMLQRTGRRGNHVRNRHVHRKIPTVLPTPELNLIPIIMVIPPPVELPTPVSSPSKRLATVEESEEEVLEQQAEEDTKMEDDAEGLCGEFWSLIEGI